MPEYITNGLVQTITGDGTDARTEAEGLKSEFNGLYDSTAQAFGNLVDAGVKSVKEKDYDAAPVIQGNLKNLNERLTAVAKKMMSVITAATLEGGVASSEELETAQKEVATLTAEIDQYQEQVSGFAAYKNDQEAELTKAKEALAEKEKELAKYAGKDPKELEKLQGEYNTLKADYESKEKEVATLTEANEDLQTHAREAKELVGLVNAKYTKLDSEHKAALRANERANEELERLKPYETKVATVEQERDEAKEAAEDAVEAKGNLQEQYDNEKAAREAADKTAQEKAQEAEEAGQRATKAEAQLDPVQQKLEEKIEALGAAKAGQKTAEQEREASANAAKAATEAQQEAEKERDAAKEALENKKLPDDYDAIKAERDRLKAELEGIMNRGSDWKSVIANYKPENPNMDAELAALKKAREKTKPSAPSA